MLARHHMRLRKNECDAPSAILSRKGLARWWGQVSRLGLLSPHLGEEKELAEGVGDNQDTFDYDKGQKSAISGKLLRRKVLSFLQWNLAIFSRVSV